jgi:hypothetical protein
MKSMFAPLSVVTTWNGPHLLGAGKPKISARNVADALLSPAYTMVWLKLIDMPTSLAFADMRNADTRSLVQSTDLIGFGRKAVLKSKMAAGRREA